MTEALDISLERLLGQLRGLQKEIESVSGSQIRRRGIKENAKISALVWFQQIKPELEKRKFSSDIINKYSLFFKQMLEYSQLSANKNSYKLLLRKLFKNFNSELIHEVQISFSENQHGLNISPYLEDLPSDEKKYLDEAQVCAINDCKRASIILGWCATIDRIHRKIETIGFDKLSKATEEMKNKNYGRFKSFNKSIKVDSLSDLRRMIFDTDLLWILEYLQLIDSNEHERLRHCFTMRNNSGHPGDAPITGENLYSFYSDITKIILNNDKFLVGDRKGILRQ